MRPLLQLFLLAPALLAGAEPWVAIDVDTPQTPPEWALLERHLIDTMDRAGEEFVGTYANSDGTLRWKERYEGGMNSSDDAYEGFRGFSLHHALGGSKKLDTMHRWVWEGITRQFTRYGQIYREFDSNWDWMHHGEGYVSFYPLGLADPYDEKFRERSQRFAAMYTGEDPESPNYDPELKLIRAVMNGSRGPKMEWTKRDWIPTNANLVYYHLPFDDIPGVTSSTGWINDQPEDDHFGRIVKTMSDRMARGDVPINLTVAPLIANAYLYTGDEKYVRWVEDYVGAWRDRTRKNAGITPDNVGLSGKVGEYINGNWWGGYYGWKWVRGGMDIVLAWLTAAKVAVLMTGDRDWLEMPRSQLALMQDKAREGKIPTRYDGENGWHRFAAEPPYAAVNLWAMSQSEGDWKRVEALGKNLDDPDLGWAHFVRGNNPGLPEKAFRRDLAFVAQKMRHIRNEHGDPETWYDAKWLALEPMPTDNLVRLTIGGLPVQKRGEMLHSRLRYFDPERRQAGLPPDVAALVTRIDGDNIEVELVNTNSIEDRRVLVQAGAYGEHQTLAVHLGEERIAVDANVFEVRLGAACGTTLRISGRRYANKPTYDFPWRRNAR